MPLTIHPLFPLPSLLLSTNLGIPKWRRKGFLLGRITYVTPVTRSFPDACIFQTAMTTTGDTAVNLSTSNETPKVCE